MKIIGDLEKLIIKNKMEDALKKILDITNTMSDGSHECAIALNNRWFDHLNITQKGNINNKADNAAERMRIVEATIELVKIIDKKFKTDLESGIETSNPPLGDYYKFYGLRGFRSGNLIQDFNVSGEGCSHNVNPIQFLWADALYGNTISAYTVNNIKGENFLRIKFNHRKRWGCNVAIRCQDGLACWNENNLKYLTFNARIPLIEIEKLKRTTKSNVLDKEVGISVRIVNGLLQHWEYAIGPGAYKILPVRANKWGSNSIVKVDLSDTNFWYLFTSDGNFIDDHSTPDFSVIAAVILKLGKIPEYTTEPGPGEGIVDIGAIHLSDD